jgi:hypothetical protein
MSQQVIRSPERQFAELVDCPSYQSDGMGDAAKLVIVPLWRVRQATTAAPTASVVRVVMTKGQ